MYKFCAVEYFGKIAKIEVLRVSRLLRKEVGESPEGRMRAVVDVTNLVALVAIWPRRSGWGFGYVDLVQQVTGTDVGMYEADDEGSPVTKRWFGLVKVTWEPGALEREGWLGERFGPSEGGYLWCGEVSQEDLEKIKQKLASMWKGETLLRSNSVEDAVIKGGQVESGAEGGVI